MVRSLGWRRPRQPDRSGDADRRGASPAFCSIHLRRRAVVWQRYTCADSDRRTGIAGIMRIFFWAWPHGGWRARAGRAAWSHLWIRPRRS